MVDESNKNFPLNLLNDNSFADSIFETWGHFDETMQNDVENGNETEADVSVIDRHVRMLRTETGCQLKTFEVKPLRVLLMETQMLFVPVVLRKWCFFLVVYRRRRSKDRRDDFYRILDVA